MTLPELSIKRHVLALMLSLVLVLFGIISYQRIGVDRFPYIEFPAITVTTTLKGANPDVMDSSVTNVIETSVNAVAGIERIQSTSSPGASVVAITFALGKNVDVAFNEVQAKVNQATRRLPKEADPPIVAKVETNANPVLWLTLSGDRTPQQLNLYAANILKKKLETLEGVGEVRLGGRRDRTIRVELNLARMAALAVATKDITDAFKREHLQVPGGYLTSQNTEYLIKLDLEAHSPQELGKMVVLHRNGTPIYLQDVANIQDDLSDYRALARFNGQPTIGLGIIKVANGNTVALVNAVRQKLIQDIEPQLPPGLRISIASNDAVFIEEMVQALQDHLIEGTLLAAAIVWLFLRSVRSTLIIALAIPVSLLGAIAVMYFAGFTFNSMTLLALLLLIGVVVDDAIVVLENIFRHREHLDPDPMSAAIAGSNEVFFAVLAATLSLVAIFAPVIFLGGIIGQFFKSFAVVVTCGVLVSWLVSLTLTPMLCSRFLKVERQHGRLYYWLEAGFRALDQYYQRSIGWTLVHRWKIVLVTLGVVASSGWFFGQVGKAFVPEQDEGRFLVSLKTPLGSSIEYTNQRLQQVEAILARQPEITSYFAVIGLGQAGQVNQGTAFVRLKPRSERPRSQQALLKDLRQQLGDLAGVRAFAAPVPMVGGQRGEPLQFVISGAALEQVGTLAQNLQKRLQSDRTLGRVDLDLQLDLPQITLDLDRTRANGLGISSEDVALALNMLTGGVDMAKYNDAVGDGQRYDIRVKAANGSLRQINDLRQIWLRNKNGQLVRLDTLAIAKTGIGPAIISRYNLQYAAQFYVTPTIPLGEAVAKVKAASTDLPPGYRLNFLGEAEEMGKTAGYMQFAFGMALLLLYMVLASQFNSFLQPFIIMVAQPLAIIGGVMGLWLTGHTLNIYSMIGLVLLIGLVAKNSILLVDLTNQRRHEGLDIDAALLNACPTRLRPVLMTSATVILALLPAALGFGAGAETNAPLAVAVIGGMISSTLLTLVVVPAVYSLLMHGVTTWQKRRQIST